MLNDKPAASVSSSVADSVRITSPALAVSNKSITWSSAVESGFGLTHTGFLAVQKF
jgi:hypothetical protein